MLRRLLFASAYTTTFSRSKLLDDPVERERQRLHLVNRLTPPEVVAGLKEAVRDALSKESPCVPAGAVLLTYSNAYHAPFMALTQRALHRSSTNRCNVMRRYVAVCFGHNSSSHCVPAPAVKPSDHRKGMYHELIWIKWSILEFALEVPGCDLAFFFDADVVLLQNPFRALEVHLQAPLAQHSFRLKKFRFMYQPTGPWEGGVMRHPAMPKPKLPRGNDAHDPRGKHGLARYGRPLCGDLAAIHPRHELNIGQMFVPDRHLVHTILQAKPLSFRASSELDQQVVSKLLHLDLQPKSTKDPRTHRHPANSSADGGFSACMLPEGFTEHCWCRNNITCAVDICSMVTYHATCFSTFNQKYAGALAAVERFEQPACRLWRREFPL